jgi:outer membrane protein OmpA-like peptidoglycan-associated protein
MLSDSLGPRLKAPHKKGHKLAKAKKPPAPPARDTAKAPATTTESSTTASTATPEKAAAETAAAPPAAPNETANAPATASTIEQTALPPVAAASAAPKEAVVAAAPTGTNATASPEPPAAPKTETAVPPTPPDTAQASAQVAPEPTAKAKNPTKTEAPVEPPKETQLAARSEAEASNPVGGTDQLVRILFPTDDAALPASSNDLLADLAARLSRDAALRLQVQAYAAGTTETASRAKRLSLNRALAVRAALVDRGVRSTRIDVRANGAKPEGGPADRVDVVIVQR